MPAGAEARAGATLIQPGTRIGPQHIALAAACGYESLSVYAKPRVAILATGDELVPLDAQPLPHQIRNSNSYSLAAQVSRHGGIPIIRPAVADTLEASEAAIRAALDCDLLLLSGGVSMGKYDFVEQALAAFDAEFFFAGARIQPGKPVVFGRLPKQNLFFFGLPGNPVSTLVTFALFAAPLLAALAGTKHLGPEFAEARLTHPVEARPGLTRFLPARSSQPPPERPSGPFPGKALETSPPPPGRIAFSLYRQTGGSPRVNPRPLCGSKPDVKPPVEKLSRGKSYNLPKISNLNLHVIMP